MSASKPGGRHDHGAVRDYNDTVQRVPDLFVARTGNFTTSEFYQARDEERSAARVEMAS